MEKISMRYTKEKSLKSRRPNEKASEMKGRIARGLLSVALVGVLTTIMPFNANANSSNVYYLGEAVNAGKDTGFSENNEITKKDPHYNWTLGSFSVNCYTRVITDDGNPIFLKTVGDEVVLDFQLEQDIDALNNDKSLMIANDKKAYDNLLYKDETAFGRGALIIRNRFKNEIIALNALKGIEGIMEVIDKQCPHVVPQTKDEAWYLMPKAKPYKLNRKRNIYSKILEMLQLARIIQSIHERDKAHRDIKPENILVLNGKLVLSDFGLCWGIGEERLTGLNERVGPYKIMPPELERVQTDLDLDFKPSDVYLFSKVLWMTLKGDNIGFRGQYQRGEVQIYLNKEDYDNVITLEPIHKLMEEATFEEMGKRISIQKCIEYLELQRKILNREEYELLSNEFVSQLLYDEYSKKIIACSKPDELTYKDAAIITHMLRDIIPISNIFVKSLHSDQNIKQIQITDFQVGMDGICKLLYYNKGIKIKEYLLNISKMNYSNYSSVISLELNDISLVDEGYIAYSAAGHGFGNEYPRVYFSSGEKIIIKRKENL